MADGAANRLGGGFPSLITLHGHRRPRLYRDVNLARPRAALSSIILP